MLPTYNAPPPIVGVATIGPAVLKAHFTVGADVGAGRIRGEFAAVAVRGQGIVPAAGFVIDPVDQLR